MTMPLRLMIVLCWVMIVSLPVVGVSAAPAGREERSPYPQHAELYQKVEAILKGEGRPKELEDETAAALRASIAALREAPKLTPKLEDALQEALALHVAVDRFAGEGNDALVLAMLQEPGDFVRLLHVLDEQDDIPAAMDVLLRLRERDPKFFEQHFELCAAFAAVWDQWKGYWWVQKKHPLADDAMLRAYDFYKEGHAKLTMDPTDLPAELAVFVVANRLTDKERAWVLQNFRRSRLLGDPTKMYASVPWTKALSPAHGTGEGIDYTLPNIQKVGGVCMEQAYFCESVFRTLGVPAMYSHGIGTRGTEQTNHAWAGVLMLRPQPHFDFDSGRYTYDRYYRGDVYDPTGDGNRDTLSEDRVQMLAGLANQGIESIRKSRNLSMAALWWAEGSGDAAGRERKGRKGRRDREEETPATETAEPAEPSDAGTEGGEDVAMDLWLAEKAIEENPFNAEAWDFLAASASAGRLDAATSLDWAQRLAERTVRACPEYLVAQMPAFLQPVQDAEQKARIYDKAFDALKVTRPDLASTVKVWEGDLHLSQGEPEKAVKAYLYPLVSFSDDQHVLEIAEQRLNALDTSVDETKREEIYKDIARALSRLGPKASTAQQTALNLALTKLESIYRDRGDHDMAQRMRGAMVQVEKGTDRTGG